MTFAPPTPVDRTRLSDRAAAELRRLIVQGTYPPGSKLPSGDELARLLGVTRLTVREALAHLETAGLLRIRHGSGTYVCDPTETANLQVLSETLSAGRDLTPDELRALLQFRAVVILGFVQEIATRVQPRELELLEALLRDEEAALGDAERLAKLDLRFNELLALASGNLFYTLLMRSVARAHLHLGEIVFRHSGDGAVVVETHRAIVRALHRRDPAALRRRLRAYIDGGNAIVASSLAQRSEGSP